MQYGQFPDPRFTIAHLSDVHLLSPGRKQYDAIVPEMGLVHVLDRLSRVRPAPQALVFTGDLADKAEPAAYARLRDACEVAGRGTALSQAAAWLTEAAQFEDRSLGDLVAAERHLASALRLAPRNPRVRRLYRQTAAALARRKPQ